ncbi:UxaA family hydrolase [Mesosutterella sp. AGMB02718]|uniref:UxaA family hydrolase n=1 Tax=Mesosutterella faecium TaxID=2925194 RepID=A0ABT7IPL5_9BURK|nr:UxaA family hydrolase [Mesosutterella sp. AGMB02718]MDL2060314.1 UxaA family hydrolase [Mesosutterella sp. AGMB02718]
MLALKLTAKDTVATALDDAKPGDRIELLLHGEDRREAVTAQEPIPFGFKVCAAPMKKGDPVIKYGLPIGRATRDIRAGELVHVHNIEGCRGRGDLEEKK